MICNPSGIFHWPGTADQHRLGRGLDSRPARWLPFDDIEPHGSFRGDFQRDSAELPLSLCGMSIAEIEESPGVMDGELEGVALSDIGYLNGRKNDRVAGDNGLITTRRWHPVARLAGSDAGTATGKDPRR